MRKASLYSLLSTSVILSFNYTPSQTDSPLSTPNQCQTLGSLEQQAIPDPLDRESVSRALITLDGLFNNDEYLNLPPIRRMSYLTMKGLKKPSSCKNFKPQLVSMS